MKTLSKVCLPTLLVVGALGGVTTEGASTGTGALWNPVQVALLPETALPETALPETAEKTPLTTAESVHKVDVTGESKPYHPEPKGEEPGSSELNDTEASTPAQEGRITVRQPPIEGSHLDPEENLCATCHGESDLWEGDQLRLYVSPEDLAEDVHWRHGVNCHDCHGGDPTSFDVPEAHSTQVFGDTEVLPFCSPLVDVKQVCGNCHHDQLLQLRKGVHTHAGDKREDGTGMVLGCNKCHGEKTHGMLPVGDSRSPVYLDHQLLTCGGCHEEDLETYKTTVHGHGLYRSGLTVTAVCADCHGAHGIYYAADKRSTLHTAGVADTCGKCHRHIGERIEQSVHGQGGKPGALMAILEKGEKGGKPLRMPSCTDCHQGHHLLDPEQAPFRMQITNRCGNCHLDFSSRYSMSLHGELTQLGYEPAAKCSDCHGAHEMLPIADPCSPLRAGKNRLETCRKCHTHAVPSFSRFDPHANHKDAENYPFLYDVHHVLRVLFFSFFAFFVVHSCLWFIRSFIQALWHGRHKTLVTGQYALMRSDATQRILYAILFVSFLGLILTGLPPKYGSQSWAQALVRGLGGFETTSTWHHFFATTAFFGCATHLVRGIMEIVKLRKKNSTWGTILFGPDSRLPTLRDGREMFGMGRWFIGLGPQPRFERWTYWEKFDYWAVYLTAVVIGTSGLMLWYPNLFCRFLPGEAINVAQVVHKEISIYAASFLFMFHFYNNHFRPEKFPIDLSILTGLVSEEHLRKYRPEYVARLFREGKLDEIRHPAPSHRRLWFAYLSGSVALLVGLCLLLLVLLAMLGK